MATEEQYNIWSDIDETIKFLCEAIRNEERKYESSTQELTIALAELIEARAKM